MICLALLICESWELCDTASGCGGKWAAQKHTITFSFSPTVHTAAALSKQVHTNAHRCECSHKTLCSNICTSMEARVYVWLYVSSIICPENSQLFTGWGSKVFSVSGKSNALLTEMMQVGNKCLHISIAGFNMVQKTIVSHSIPVSGLLLTVLGWLARNFGF